MPKGETRADKFHRLAEARVNKILKMIRLLGNLSGIGYDYTSEQVEQIFTALQTELGKAKQRYTAGAKYSMRFSLSENQNESDRLEVYPSIRLALPDGTCLRAVAIDDENFPAINIYLERDVGDEQEEICFVEYNPERDEGPRVCIGVYRSDDEDTKYYAPYMAERNQNEKISPEL